MASKKEKMQEKAFIGRGQERIVISDDGAVHSGINGLNGGLEGISLSSSEPRRLNDVSSLLFYSKSINPPSRLPFLGPISVSERGSIGANISHGRGLITTRDVSPGECLFVLPSVFSADAADVRERYLQEKIYGRDDARTVERLAEDQIVQKVQSACDLLSDEEIQPKCIVDRARMQLSAFISQMSSERVPAIDCDALMSILVANEPSPILYKDTENLDMDTILSIIRRNAFGPDFHNYDKLAKCWTERADTENCYDRLLAIYPLAAMINHSCSPNAVRVFGRLPSQNRNSEVMIVHANAHIPKGKEITWSYLPPATPLAVRRGMLLSKYGFTCRCTRCAMEEEALSISEFQGLFAHADRGWSSRDLSQRDEGEATITLVSSLERFFSTKQIPIEAQRYLRVGYALLYIDSFNAPHSLENDEDIGHKLQIATQLHFSFVSCNNASTEHLSILHLCYDLSSQLRTIAMRGNEPNVIARATSQVHFWTDQLKKAHMIRYGKLGEDLENVRDAMKHSKLVLRNLDGWYLTKDLFI